MFVLRLVRPQSQHPPSSASASGSGSGGSGTIWLIDGNTGIPAAHSRRFKVSARSNNALRRAASARTCHMLASAAAAIIGGGGVK